MKKAIIACAVLLLVGTVAAEQMPRYEATGTIDFVLGATALKLYTTQNSVPNEPGREVHTASWVVLKPMLMGGINIAPDDVLVVVGARPTIEPEVRQSELRIEFSLDPDTLQHRDSVPVTAKYEPGAGADALAWENVKVLSMQVESIDDETFRLTAELEGTINGNADEAFKAVLDLQSLKKR